MERIRNYARSIVDDPSPDPVAPSPTDYFAIAGQVLAGSLPLVDTRSPGEFHKGAMPGAINLPLFTDGQRHEIGLTYKTRGQAEAVTLGMEFFEKGRERYHRKLTDLAGNSGSIALHCWRGGMRSGAIAEWLSLCGIRVFLLAGGYKVFRRQVLERMDRLGRHRLLVLDGRTGCGKTAFLRSLPPTMPVIDFEGLARHRGSALGDFNQPEPPPTQQNFENRLAVAYERCRQAPVILVESENFLGPIELPRAIRDQIRRSEMVHLERDFADRVRLLVEEYTPGWSEQDDQQFALRMDLFRKHLSPALRQNLTDLIRQRRFTEAVTILLQERYDWLYDRHLQKHKDRRVLSFNLTREEAGARRTVLARLSAREP